MALKRITPAASMPVTLAEAKLHLRVDTTDDDALITNLIVAATGAAELHTGRAFMQQTWELTLDAFPDALEITRVPAISVTSLKYFDTAGVQQTMLSTLYTLDNADDFGLAYVVPAYNTSWPETRDQINAVALRYVAGYPDAASVPERVKAWIRMQVGAMYENRETVSQRQSYSLGFADHLLDEFVVYA